MGLVVLDAAKIVSNVLPNLTKSKNFLNEAYSTSGNLKSSLPSSFGNRSLVNEIANQLYSLKREIGNIEQIISKKIESARRIETKSESKVSSIAAKIGSVAGALGGAVIGSRYGAVGAVAAGAIGAKVGSKATKTIADTGAKVVCKIVSVAKGISSKIKNTASSIVKNSYSILKSFVKGTINNVKQFGKSISEVTKTIFTDPSKVFIVAREQSLDLLKSNIKGTSDFIQTLGKSIYNTGATIVKEATSSVKSIGKAVWGIATKVFPKTTSKIESLANKFLDKTSGIYNKIKEIIGKTKEGIKKVASTIVVGYTSVMSGVAKLVEWIDDGLTWLGGMTSSAVVSIFSSEKSKEIQDATMDFIARDRVQELNDSFYQNTSLGRTINENSYLKYDSEAAKKIQNISTKVAEFTAATALTVATAGMAAPLSFAIVAGTGALEYAGKTAETKFQDRENRNFWKDSISISANAVAGGVQWYFTGKMGQQGLSALKSLTGSGKIFGATISNEGFTTATKGLLNKGKDKLIKILVNLKNISWKGGLVAAKDTVLSLKTHAISLGMSSTNIVSAIENWVNTGKFNIGDWKKVGKDYVKSLGFQTLFSFIIGGVQQGKINQIAAENSIKAKEIIQSNESKALKFYNDSHPNEQFASFEDLYTAHPEEATKIIYDEYRLKVLEDKVDWNTRQKIASEEYDLLNGDGSFKQLSDEAKKFELKKININTQKYQELYNKNLEDAFSIADDTISSVEKLVANGNVRNGYTAKDIISMIESGVPQETYLTSEYVSEYYSKYGIPDSKGNVKVVAFQDGDPGGNNFVKFKGKVGTDDGMFIMPKNEANAIIEKCTINGKIDTSLLTKELGGVPFGENVIMIEQNVNINDIGLPTGNLRSAYLGDWRPGGMTSGGITEGVIKQTYYNNQNVSISAIAGNKTRDDYISDLQKLMGGK